MSEQIKNAYAVTDKIISRFDFIIYEQFFFLGKHLAEKHHKPVARIFTAPVTNQKLMKESIISKGPLSIFKHKWIARAFTKDIAKNIPLKNTVLSVLLDSDIKNNIVRVQQLINEAPDNKGGAEFIINYYKDYI